MLIQIQIEGSFWFCQHGCLPVFHVQCLLSTLAQSWSVFWSASWVILTLTLLHNLSVTFSVAAYTVLFCFSNWKSDFTCCTQQHSTVWFMRLSSLWVLFTAAEFEALVLNQVTVVKEWRQTNKHVNRGVCRAAAGGVSDGSCWWWPSLTAPWCWRSPRSLSCVSSSHDAMMSWCQHASRGPTAPCQD